MVESFLCIACGRTEIEVPLVILQFRSRRIYLCPQCLPVMIHHPERLTQKLEEAAK